MGVAPPPYGTARAGTEWWHVYPLLHASNSFNPSADSRFSLRPDRAMYYTGTTPSAALWETVLRDLVPDRSRAVVVPLDPRNIVKVRLERDVPVLDLYTPPLNEIAGVEERREQLQFATLRRDYPATHAIARELLVDYPDAVGLRWHSRQAAKEIAAVFYEPPGVPDWFTELELIGLSSAKGLALIDAALAEHNMVRIEPTSLPPSATPPPGVY